MRVSWGRRIDQNHLEGGVGECHQTLLAILAGELECVVSVDAVNQKRVLDPAGVASQGDQRCVGEAGEVSLEAIVGIVVVVLEGWVAVRVPRADNEAWGDWALVGFGQLGLLVDRS